MGIQKLVPDKKTCQKLQSSGVELDTEWWWVPDTSLIHKREAEHEWEKYVPAPLLSEILDVMPNEIYEDDVEEPYYPQVEMTRGGYKASYSHDLYIPLNFQRADNPSEAAAQLLIFLVEEGHVNPDEL